MLCVVDVQMSYLIVFGGVLITISALHIDTQVISGSKLVMDDGWWWWWDMVVVMVGWFVWCGGTETVSSAYSIFKVSCLGWSRTGPNQPPPSAPISPNQPQSAGPPIALLCGTDGLVIVSILSLDAALYLPGRLIRSLLPHPHGPRRPSIGKFYGRPSTKSPCGAPARSKNPVRAPCRTAPPVCLLPTRPP